MARKSTKKNVETITDFGTRQVNQQNFSRTVVLPKTALQNCGCNLEERDIKVNVSLVQKDDAKFIKLTPICENKENEDE
jgi:hypothetical protein